MGLPNPSRETKFSGANGEREILIFPVQLTTSRIGTLTRLILALAIYDDHTHIFIINFTSFIADGPRCHPACGHLGSSHLSPVHALRVFIAMQVQHSYKSSN